MNGDPPTGTPDPYTQPPPPIRQGYSIPAVQPRLTYIFLAVNVLVFLGQAVLQLIGGRTAANLLLALGAKINELIIAGQYYRLVTPIFLHGGILHLGFNSYALHVIGPSVERPFGHARFFILYMLSGITGSLFSFVFNPDPSVGASGAIFGLIGASGVYLFNHRRVFGPMARQRLNSILSIIVINLVIGLNPGIDNWGHVGGLIGGAVLAWLIGPMWRLEQDYTGAAHVVDGNPLSRRWLAVFAFLLALIAGVVVGVEMQP